MTRDRSWEEWSQNMEPDPFGEKARPWCQDGCDQPVAVCVHSLPASLPDDRTAIDRLLDEAGPDELAVMLHVARRLIGIGQRQYGLLSIANDARDFKAEAGAEFSDAIVYGAIAGLKRCIR